MDQESAPAVPRHVGIIADGNRRWAKQFGLPAWEGHLAGYNALKDAIFQLVDADVAYISTYIFSTENWQRPRPEVAKIMEITLRIFTSDLDEYMRRGIRIRVLGIKDGLSDKLVSAINDAETKSAHLAEATLCICFNYGGQREIIDATRRLLAEGVDPESVTEESFAQYLYAPDVPPVDIVVRTSGEHRLSNFMLWRAAYSEFLFIDKFLPDLRSEDVQAIIDAYGGRHRRFGA
ncbi:di-trans,poly-cis-decaprenylcistransferase [Candidatus Saccharibacteria bacterium]|nr:di-trans,poly-cis-decaprenylcistransferase [Candidatus Saccharibacteria bacterium]